MSLEGPEVWRGGVAAWECDAMGHLNVGFYVVKAMEGLVGLAAELGMPAAFSPRAEATLLVREQYIRFLREARPDAPLTMTGGVLEIGEDTARLLLVLRHADGAIAAAFQTLVAHVTAGEGRLFPWSQAVLDRAAALRVEVPAEARPRSMALDPVGATASLARADALDLDTIARGAVRTVDCDSFGRMRPEMMLARLADGSPHLLDGAQAAPEAGVIHLGGAVLEYRLVHFAWPRAGDRFVVRSGVADVTAKMRRLVHWMLDPATGRAWGVAEVVGVCLDLDRRKVVPMSAASLADFKAREVAGLSLG